jgi:autophagy-related protein 9
MNPRVGLIFLIISCRIVVMILQQQRIVGHGRFGIFSAYFLFALWNFGQTVSDARQCKWIFEQRLGIPEHKLQAGAVEWDVICTKLMQLQTSGEYRIAIPRGGSAPNTGPLQTNNINDTTSSSTADGGATQSTADATTEGNASASASNASAATGEAQELDALMIAHRILRKENFLVALFNKGLLNLTVPWWLAGCGTGRKTSNMTDNSIFETFYCPTLEWSLYFCILNFMWNHKYHVRPAFYLDPQALSRRFVVCGVAHLIFMPFLLFFITLHFALQNAYDYKSTKQYLGPREWSPVAKWTFREFNELPHIFERRLAPSYKAAEDYLKLFTQSEVVTTVGRILVFCGGSCGAVLFVFAAMNDAILLHVKIADWNLLWYAGIVGIVYSIGKALLPNGNPGQPRRYVRNMYAEMDAALRQVATHTHYYPQVWQARGWDKNSTHKCFSAMFQYKAQLFVHQVMSAVLAPYILCVSLPQCSEAICEFVLAVKTELPAEAGEVCG